jgi:hypothetical protein
LPFGHDRSDGTAAELIAARLFGYAHAANPCGGMAVPPFRAAGHPPKPAEQARG